MAFQLFRVFEQKWKEAYKELDEEDPTTYVLKDAKMIETLHRSRAKDYFVDKNVDMREDQRRYVVRLSSPGRHDGRFRRS